MRHLYDVIIIGGGPGGYTAALYAARAGLDTLVLEKLSAGGQMALTTQIDNYPGFEAGIDGFTLGEKMQQGAERFGAKTEIVEVDGVHLQGPVKTVHTNEGIFEAKTVILAMGAHPRKLVFRTKRDWSVMACIIVLPVTACFIKIKQWLLWAAATARLRMHCFCPESVKKSFLFIGEMSCGQRKCITNH